MQNLRENIKNYYPDIRAFLILFILFAFFAIIFVGYQGNPIIDCFAQGAYIPSEILKGKILYKDLLVPYGPLSYQFNALLFLVFGEHLNTLYGAGIVTSLIILTTFYLIARTVTSRMVAFTVSFMVLALCIYHHYIFNYIFPYAYAMVYAFSAFLLALLLCIYYLKTSKEEFITFAFLFMGISILMKVDYALFLIVILAIALFLKPISRKTLAISISIALIIPMISWGILFIQGLNIHDLSTFLYYFNRFLQSPVSKHFYEIYTGLYFNLFYFKFSIAFFFTLIMLLALSLLSSYPLLLFVHNKFKFPKFRFPGIVRSALTLLFIGIFIKLSLVNKIPDIIFNWTAITASLILAGIMISNCISLNKKINCQEISLTQRIKKMLRMSGEISQKDKIFILIIIAGLIGTARSYFFIDLYSFGTYYLPLVLLVNVIFLTDHISNRFKFLDSDIWIKNCSIVLISLTISFSLSYYVKARIECKYPVSTVKGTIYTNSRYSAALNPAIEYINKEMPRDAKFIMVPQGPILNFLTGHSSDGWYYDLIPPTIMSVGEDKIINDLDKNPPDYIFINNRDSSDWGFQYFGKDYGVKLNKYIEKDYSLAKVINKEFNIKIYKRK